MNMRTTTAALKRMELHMSIKTKIAAFALVAVTGAGIMSTTTQQAEARGRFGVGIAAGLVGVALVGSAIVARPVMVDDDDDIRSCVWVRQFNSFGEFIGRVRTCD